MLGFAGILSASPEDWRSRDLHSDTAVIVSQSSAAVELSKPDLLVVVVLLVLQELRPRYEEIVLREIILALLSPGLLLVTVLSTSDKFLRSNSCVLEIRKNILDSDL